MALAIIAITLGAIIENTSASSRNASYLRDKTIAGWVAMNQLSLVRAKRQWTSASNKKGQVVKTDNSNIRRLVVDVFTDEDDGQSLATITGYVGKL